MLNLKGKIAIVTGAASGIGKAIAATFVKAGVNVYLADINEEGGLEVCNELVKINSNTNFIKTDVSKENDLKHLILSAEEKSGKVDIIVNNAAKAIGGYPITDMSNEDWQALIAINLSSVFYGCKHTIPIFIKNGGGSIINIASAQAHTPLPGWAAYAGAKGAIISMTRQIASEFGPKNIRANSISPGTIATEMVNQVVAEDGTGELIKDFKLMHPLGRIGKPEEIGATAAFLASEEGAFVNGADIRVDGGLTITPRTSPGAGSHSKK
jgi:NAD(P)-dependent dehydrogenase (short-subunit alcohol dehydrogenase family)